MAHLQPEIGSWFEDLDSGLLFEVVAIDELQQTVEVQYLDGTLDEFELDQWQGLPVVSAPPPEDSNAAFGLTAIEQDPNVSGFEFSPGLGPLDTMEGETLPGTDESLY
ncbi:hypothetical protein SAMN04487965_0042 [Microbulbifer donghaiensis]|uniref:Uncharacterized protein n=1 Tax=Microbulbifer donghaiensis TaxID=494016 RepID=A0A1M4U2G6_9GAMM|nr:DUF6763 family protein [Microbulbifer donghaiensis]SHE50806.1 hypothetical protein SAMN04487965_0042 [Microbulbifer donghaiensis]